MKNHLPILCVIASTVWVPCVLAGDAGSGTYASPAPAAGPATQPAVTGWRAIDQKLNTLIGPVKLDDMTAKQAFAWWSQTSGIDLDINWASMETDGANPDNPISIGSSQMEAGKLLHRIMGQASPNQRLIAERTDDCIKIMTRNEANRHRVVRVYDIAELLPGARQAVNSAAAITSRHGESGSSDEAAHEIARLIGEMVEPDVWLDAGGESTIQYFRTQLIVRAPLYVQVQIGRPVAVMQTDGLGAAHKVVQVDE